MQHGEPPPVEIELVYWMPAGLPKFVVNHASAVADQLVDHVLKKAQHAVLGDVDALVYAARLDDRGGGGIVFDDGERAREEPLRSARFWPSRFHEAMKLAERYERVRLRFPPASWGRVRVEDNCAAIVCFAAHSDAMRTATKI
jgi:hypothetical protein